MNVLGPANPGWDARLALIRETLHHLQPDIVALQEVPTAPTLDTVTHLLGPHYQVTAFSHPSDDGVGGVVATLQPHRLIVEIDQRLSPDSLPWAATVLVEVDTTVGPVLVGHHKPSWPFPAEAEREAQAVRAAAAIEQHIGDRHAIVLGDFDATPDAASVQFLKGRRSIDGSSVCYTDAWEIAHPDELGLTFSADNPLVRAGEVATAASRRIDYILVRSVAHGPTLQVTSCSRLLDQPVNGVWASDHYGVITDFALPDHPPGTWGNWFCGSSQESVAD